MSVKQNLICKILGHAWQPDGAKFYCIYDCERCGHHGDGYEWDLRGWIYVRLWWLGYHLRERLSLWREWWRCSECGGRFGRHDYDKFDHIPF